MAYQPIRAETLSQGDEVVAGDIIDTNAPWLAQQLVALGIDVVRHTAVGDRLDDLIPVLADISARSQLCLCTGGLGPTCDDLTAEAVAHAFQSPLSLDATALAQIQARYRDRGQVMPEVNRKQALLPVDAKRIDNLWGTAPGFWFDRGGCRFAFMPGVPSEMRAMFQHTVMPQIQRCYSLEPARLQVLRTFGLGESQLQENLDRLPWPAGIHLGFRVDVPYVDVKVRFDHGCPHEQVEQQLARVRETLRDSLVAESNEGAPGSACDLGPVVDDLLVQAGSQLFVIDGATNGELARQAGSMSRCIEARAVRNLAELKGLNGAGPDWIDPLSALAQTYQTETGAEYVLIQASLDDGSASVGLSIGTPKGLVYRERVIRGALPRRDLMAAAWALDELRRLLSMSQI